MLPSLTCITSSQHITNVAAEAIHISAYLSLCFSGLPAPRSMQSSVPSIIRGIKSMTYLVTPPPRQKFIQPINNAVIKQIRIKALRCNPVEPDRFLLFFPVIAAGNKAIPAAVRGYVSTPIQSVV